MATTLTDLDGYIFINANIQSEKNDVLATTVDPLDYKLRTAFEFTDADQIYHDSFVLEGPQTGTSSLNLYDGSLKNPFGGDISFSRVYAIIIRNNSIEDAVTGSADILVGQAGTDAFVGWFDDETHGEILNPGGISVHISKNTGWLVDATHCELEITNAGDEDVTVEVIIIGDDS